MAIRGGARDFPIFLKLGDRGLFNLGKKAFGPLELGNLIESKRTGPPLSSVKLSLLLWPIKNL